MRLLQRRIWFRVGAGAVAAAAAASVFAISGTARAVEGGADLAVGVPGTAVVQDAGKPFAINVHNNGPATATGIKLTIDTSKLDTSKLEVFQPGPACKVDGTAMVFTCPVPDLLPGGNYNGFNPSYPDLVVKSIGDAGAAGSFTVSVTSDTPDSNQANNHATTNVNVVTGGIDMVAWARDVYPGKRGTISSSRKGTQPTQPTQPTQRIQPGETGELVWMLWNQGNSPIKGVKYTIVLPHYLTFDSPPKSGCEYEANNAVAHCQDKEAIVGPGEAYGVNPENPGEFDPILVRLAKNAPGPVSLTGGIVTGHGLAECGRDCAPPEVPAIRAQATSQHAGVLSAAEATKVKNSVKSTEVAPATPDADPKDNSAPFSAFTARNPADLSISATPVSGHVGDTVSVKLTVKNAGPADALGAKVTLTAPAGTEFVSVDQEKCTATTAGKAYSCDLRTAPAGESTSVTVGLKIVSATVVDGKAVVSSKVEDPNPGNNTAPITVTVLPGSASPSTAASAPSAPPAGGAGGGTGGGLPVTGAPVGLVSALGLGIAAVGGVLMVLARRRRAVSALPID